MDDLISAPPVLIEVKLHSSHDHDFKYRRPDGSVYKVIERKDKEPVIEEVINYELKEI